MSLIEAEAAIPGLRPVADSDSEAIIELIGGIWSTYEGVILDVDAEEPWMREPASYYATNGGRLWVVGDPVTATAAGRWAKGETSHSSDAGESSEQTTFELKSMYVHASLRRQRMGQRLVSVVEAYAREAGATRMVLWSDTKFLEAHAFYATLGYRRTGRERELHDLSGTVEYEFDKAL